MSERRPPARWEKAAIVFVSILLFFAALEAILRLGLNPNPPPVTCVDAEGQKTYQATVDDPLLGFRYRPSISCYDREGDTRLVTNSRGLADGEHAYANAGGAIRILIVGDSQIQHPILDEARWATAVLQGRLGSKYEVINAAMQGYSTAQEMVFLKEEGLLYSPDIVVLAFYTGNDGLDNTVFRFDAPRPIFDLTQDGSLEMARYPHGNSTERGTNSEASPLRRLLLWLYENSGTVEFLADGARRVPQIHEFGIRVGLFTNTTAENPVPTSSEFQVEVSRALVLEIARVASEHSVRLIVVVIPSASQFSATALNPSIMGVLADTDPDGLRRMLLSLDQHGIEVVDLLPLLADLERSGVRTYDESDHLNEEGQRLLAQALYSRITSTGTG